MLKPDSDPDFAESYGVPDQVLYNKNIKKLCTVELILDQQTLMTSKAHESHQPSRMLLKREVSIFSILGTLLISLDPDPYPLTQMTLDPNRMRNTVVAVVAEIPLPGKYSRIVSN